jgi:hypothetical protein
MLKNLNLDAKEHRERDLLKINEQAKWDVMAIDAVCMGIPACAKMPVIRPLGDTRLASLAVHR